ncbi:ABC transporter substrate-binding protein [Geomesophilobacter sediminis]|uniref:ABC transporter substrate-binding protein n=1 Tax=Geomesophilobacter sediminis TaxID=2798584 RepID=A0A8J7LY96_9BACT|nr:ABC transporter substrate-binding protein [Geomesophilobacter sediminis]MBJ6724357.1 ABC transporter substrate-binding protein [Geomesophilobacter sediminis]
MKRRFITLAVAVMATLWGGVVSAQDRKLDVVKLPDPFIPNSVSSYYVADELGFFRDEGIKAEFVGVVPTPQLVAAVMAGKVDVGGAHANRTIAGISAGAKVRAVVAQSETTRERPHMVFVTLANSPIKAPKDLLGKRLAIMAFGGCNEYTPYEYLRKHGVANPKGKLNIVTTPPGKEIDALRRGAADFAGVHIDPKDVQRLGGLRILFTDYDVWGTIGGATPLYFSDKFIKEKPDVVRRFVRVMARTNNWINANPGKAEQIHAKRAKVDPSIVNANHFAPDGVIKEESVQLWIDILDHYHDIRPGIKTAEVYTNAFNAPPGPKKKAPLKARRKEVARL